MTEHNTGPTRRRLTVPEPKAAADAIPEHTIDNYANKFYDKIIAIADLVVAGTVDKHG